MTEVLPLWALGLLAFSAASVGTLGGMGGAVLLVPALVVAGVAPSAAAPIGLLTVAAASLAAGAEQLASGLVHQRLGVSTEMVTSAGAIAGAVLAGLASAEVLVWVLAGTALLAAAIGSGRRGVRNRPQPIFAAESAGEWPGTLGGAYVSEGGVVPYQVQRLPAGLTLLGASGVLAGLTGSGGGFLKTPIMSEVMHVPVKVAAATSTFTVGLTAMAALVVHGLQGGIDLVAGGAAVAGALLGGRAGAVLQDRISPGLTRRVLSLLLVAVAVVLVLR